MGTRGKRVGKLKSVASQRVDVRRAHIRVTGTSKAVSAESVGGYHKYVGLVHAVLLPLVPRDCADSWPSKPVFSIYIKYTDPRASGKGAPLKGVPPPVLRAHDPCFSATRVGAGNGLPREPRRENKPNTWRLPVKRVQPAQTSTESPEINRPTVTLSGA